MVKRRRLSLGAWLVAVALLAGCAQQRIRDEANHQLRDGRYEQAIQTLKDGVAEYPESALLRSGLASAQTDVVTRLLAQVAQQRAAGQWQAAQETLGRALALYPEHPRVRDLQAQLVGPEIFISSLREPASTKGQPVGQG